MLANAKTGGAGARSAAWEAPQHGTPLVCGPCPPDSGAVLSDPTGTAGEAGGRAGGQAAGAAGPLGRQRRSRPCAGGGARASAAGRLTALRTALSVRAGPWRPRVRGGGRHPGSTQRSGPCVPGPGPLRSRSSAGNTGPCPRGSEPADPTRSQRAACWRLFKRGNAGPVCCPPPAFPGSLEEKLSWGSPWDPGQGPLCSPSSRMRSSPNVPATKCGF